MKKARKNIKKEKRKWYQKLRDKYRLVIMDENTLEEKLSFKLSRLNVFIVLGTLSIILVFLTTYIIAFTPLREYIPGYSSVGLQRNVYELGLKADSIEQDFRQKDIYIQNLKNIIAGKGLAEETQANSTDSVKEKSYANIADKRSKEDEMLRNEVEGQNKYALMPSGKETPVAVNNNMIGSLNFFCPLKGMIINSFSSGQHFGVDVSAQKNEAIKAALSGTVVFSGWTTEDGWVIVLQNTGNVITAYKHCSILLKKQGDYVRAGEPISIVGETGERSSGPHLHFELWYNGTPVDPKEYISW